VITTKAQKDLIDETEKELTPEERKKIAKMEKKGIRTFMCPKCKTIYQGKYLANIVVCGKCGWRNPNA